MTTAEILSLISTICYGIAAISFALAILFWFKFKIPSVIGDLSGRTARKSIERMRAKNERAGGQGYRPSAANVDRGKLTETMHHSQKLTNDVPAPSPKKAEAKKGKKIQPEDQIPETGLLKNNLASVANGGMEIAETTGLLVDEDGTELLQEAPKMPPKRVGGKAMTMLDEVVLIHTDEVL